MDNAMNITSEQELLGLKNEGKISESEYAELLSAMRKAPSKGAEPEVPSDEAASKQKLGKIAFYLMLAGIAVPTAVFLVSFAITGGGEGDVIFSWCFFLCALIELSAFVFGVISWPDVYGKATVAVVAAMAVLALLFVA